VADPEWCLGPLFAFSPFPPWKDVQAVGGWHRLDREGGPVRHHRQRRKKSQFGSAHLLGGTKKFALARANLLLESLSAGRFFNFFDFPKSGAPSGWPAVWLAPGRQAALAASAAHLYWGRSPAQKKRATVMQYMLQVSRDGPKKGV